MKLKIRYDDEYQEINLSAKDTDALWVSLSLEEKDEFTAEERELKLQQAFEEKYNKPEYNNWHKENRHKRYSKAFFSESDDTSMPLVEPYMSELRDERVYLNDEIKRSEDEEYEAVCEWIRTVLANKPDWAEAVIAVYIDGVNETEYADSIGQSQSNVAHKLMKAKKKLKENKKSYYEQS